jgi:hypothetical protein
MTNKRIIFIAKPDTWYKEYTSAEIVADGRPQMNSAVFRGIRVCDGLHNELHKLGEEYIDEELCSFEEFIEVKIEEVLDE